MISFGKGFGNDLYMGDDSLTETYTSMKPTEGLRSTELTTLAKIEQRQESGRTVIEIDTPLSKSQFEKVKKVIASTKQKPVGEEASKLEQIEDFLRRHKTFHDVPVKDMRHIIPLFLMEVYVEKYGQYTKKVKGLWEKRPEDWPETVPFVDPNNRLKNEGEKKNVKPKKELLGQMLTYLVDRYTKMKSAAEASDGFLLHVNDPMLSVPHQSTMQFDDLSHYGLNLNLLETNDIELRAAEQSVSDQSLSTGHNSGYSSLPGYSFVFHQNVKPSLSSVTNDGSMIHSSLSTVEDPLSGGVDLEHGELQEDGPYGELQWAKQPDLDARPPEQVVDNEEETSSMKDWNPLEEICERTRLKLGYMRMKVLVAKAMQDELESIHGVLKKRLVAVSVDDDKLELLEKWYELEKYIDGAKFQQPCTYSKMIQNLHDELIPKMVPLMDFLDNNTVKSKSMDMPIPAEDSQQINSILNIRPRPGTAGGTAPFPHVNQLEVRYLTSEQSASSNGCRVSTLSDNHKPIQLAQEDGEAQKSAKLEENLVTRDESLPFNISDDDYLLELLSQLDQLSCPIQESGPVTQSTSQLVGKLEMPVDPLQHVMTSVSVQPWGSANHAMMMSTPCYVFSSPPTVAPSQQISNASVGSPSTAFAEECFNRLSLSVNPDPSPQPVQRAHPCPPIQPNLDELLCKKPRASGRPGGKRSYLPMDEDDDLDKIVSGPSKPAKVSTYNNIPLVVEEISNNLDKPFPRVLKKKSCR